MARPTDPRTRPALLRASSQLFYARGVASTSLDEVVEAAGLTKPTLYRHFASKDALLAAYLEGRHEELGAELRAWLAASPPSKQPSAVVEWLCDWISRPDFNGCAFVRGLAELPQDEAVRERAKRRKRALLETIEEACRAAGADDPPALAAGLLLIVEGATTTVFVNGDVAGACRAARALARSALEAAGHEP
jgi:AcrR family transcriptional regulator